MIYGIDATIYRNFNVVRFGIARASTVARFLRKVKRLSEYRVTFLQGDTVYRHMPGADFLALYDAGLIGEAITLSEYHLRFTHSAEYTEYIHTTPAVRVV